MGREERPEKRGEDSRGDEKSKEMIREEQRGLDRDERKRVKKSEW